MVDYIRNCKERSQVIGVFSLMSRGRVCIELKYFGLRMEDSDFGETLFWVFIEF